MNYLFLDTNVIQHTITHLSRENLLEVHYSNIDFYTKSNVFLLPQVITELDEVNISYTEWIFKIVEAVKLDDFEEFNWHLIQSINKHIFKPSVCKMHKYRPYLEDAIYFLESTYWDWREYIEGITEMKKFLNITYNKSNESYSPWKALANIIENTSLWDE